MAVQKARSPGVLEKLRVLSNLEYSPPDEIERFQLDQLRRLIDSTSRLPRMKKLERTDGETLREILASLPILEKSDLRTSLDELHVPSMTTRYTRTGGTTGEPLTVAQDAGHSEWRTAMNLVRERWMGYRFGEPKIRIWGSERDLLSIRDSRLGRARAWLRNETVFNSFRMDRERIVEYLEAMNRIEPVLVHGYAESLFEIARVAVEIGFEPHRPRCVWSSAGTLYPSARALLERVFQAPVFNNYGSRDAGAIASECEEHNGLHVSPTHVVEILDDSGSPAPPGVAGDVVVSVLGNMAMPLLRYKIGDRAVASQRRCGCGRHWPLLERIEGRSTEALHLPSGGIVVPEVFIHLIGVADKDCVVWRFRVIQHRVGSFTILLEPRDGVDGAELVANGRALRSRIQPAVEDSSIEIEWVDRIPESRSGKVVVTECRIPGCGTHGLKGSILAPKV